MCKLCKCSIRAGNWTRILCTCRVPLNQLIWWLWLSFLSFPLLCLIISPWIFGSLRILSPSSLICPEIRFSLKKVDRFTTIWWCFTFFWNLRCDHVEDLCKMLHIMVNRKYEKHLNAFIFISLLIFMKSMIRSSRKCRQMRFNLDSITACLFEFKMCKMDFEPVLSRLWHWGFEFHLKCR